MIIANYNKLLPAIIAAYFVLFLFSGLFRHWGFLTTINDTGNFDQAIWGVLHEGYLHTTNIANQPMNRLAGHFDPILYFFVPFYALYPSVVWLIGFQSLAVSIAAWPIFLLGSRVLQSEKAGFFIALAFLFNPFILNGISWDFHPVTLAVPFIVLAMLGIEQKRIGLVLFSSVFILLCKEHFGIMVAGFGLVWLYKHRQWKHALVLIIIGIVHTVVVLEIIMPAFSISGKPGPIDRYAWLGQSVGEIMFNAVCNPFHVLKTVFFALGGGFYLFLLLVPFLGFSLIGLPFLLPGIADLATNMLANISMPRSPMSYHSVTLVPLFTVAAIYGIKNTERRIKKFSAKQLAGLILIPGFIFGYLLAPFPLPGSLNYWAPVSFVSWPDQHIQEVRSLAGNDTSISAQANIGAHFSQRKEIYRFPNQTEKVDLIILWLDSPTTKLMPLEPGPLGSLADHLQMGIFEYLETVENFVKNDEFHVSYWKDPWLVFTRKSNDMNLQKEVLGRLYELRQAWLGIEYCEKHDHE